MIPVIILALALNMIVSMPACAGNGWKDTLRGVVAQVSILIDQVSQLFSRTDVLATKIQQLETKSIDLGLQLDQLRQEHDQKINNLLLRVDALEALHVPNNSGSFLVQDNFNSYANGSLLGQGGWQNYANGHNFTVQDSVVFEGSKAVYINAFGDSVITKTGSSLSDGKQAVYVKTENRSSWGFYPDGNAQIRISKGSWASGAPGLAFAAVSFKSNGSVAYYNPVSNTYENFATYNDSEWTLLEIEWRSSDKTARYRVNGGTWTNWYPFAFAATFTNFDNVGFDFVLPNGSGGVYFDNLR